MADNARKTISNVIPTMRYHDASAAIEWLCKAFGFEKCLVVPGENGTIVHAQLVFGNGMINDFLAGMQRWGSQIDSREPWPLTTVVGFSANPGTESFFLENNTSFQYGDTMTKVVGRHTLSWGATIWRVWVNAISDALPTISAEER